MNKMSQDDLDKMKLHEYGMVNHANGLMNVLKVTGGWMYWTGDASVFVPKPTPPQREFIAESE